MLHRGPVAGLLLRNLVQVTIMQIPYGLLYNNTKNVACKTPPQQPGTAWPQAQPPQRRASRSTPSPRTLLGGSKPLISGSLVSWGAHSKTASTVAACSAIDRVPTTQKSQTMQDAHEEREALFGLPFRKLLSLAARPGHRQVEEILAKLHAAMPCCADFSTESHL